MNLKIFEKHFEGIKFLISKYTNHQDYQKIFNVVYLDHYYRDPQKLSCKLYLGSSNLIIKQIKHELTMSVL